MFPVGAYVVYQRRGVCQVEEISSRTFPHGDPAQHLYYTLRPLFAPGDETIYLPVESAGCLREVISAEEASACLEKLRQLQPDLFRSPRTHQLAAHYQELAGGSLDQQLALLKECSLKQAEARARHRRLGQVDERFLHLAQDLVYSELAVALCRTPGELQQQVEAELTAPAPAAAPL